MKDIGLTDNMAYDHETINLEYPMSEFRPICIAFYNGKGGVGKTTLSVLTASLLHNMGLKVLFIDTDPQASAYQWSVGFEDEGQRGLPFPVHLTGPRPLTKRSQLVDFINRRRTKETSVVVFDLPPVVDNLMNKIVLNVTDLIVMPVIPDQLTLDAMPASIKLIQSVQDERRALREDDPGPVFKIVINKFKKVLTVHKALVSALRDSEDLLLYDAYLGDLSGFTNASSARTSLKEVTAGANTVPLYQLRSFVDELLDDANALGWDLRSIAEAKS